MLTVLLLKQFSENIWWIYTFEKGTAFSKIITLNSPFFIQYSRCIYFLYSIACTMCIHTYMCIHTSIYTHKYLCETTSTEHWWGIKLKTSLRCYATTVKQHCMITVIPEQLSLPAVTSRNLLWFHAKCSHVDYSKSLRWATSPWSLYLYLERLGNVTSLIVLSAQSIGLSIWAYLNGSCQVLITLDIKSLALWSEWGFRNLIVVPHL